MRPVNYFIAVFFALLPVIPQAQNIDSIAAVSFPEPVSALDISGDYAYTSGTTHLYVVNTANPANPAIIGNCEVSGGRGISIDDNYLITTAGDSRVSIVDKSDPMSPSVVGYFELHTQSQRYMLVDDISLRWPYAFVAATSLFIMSEWGELSIWNIENISQPESLNTVGVPCSPLYMFVADNYAYISNWGDGIYYYGGVNIFDLSTPMNPPDVGMFSTNNVPIGIFVNGDYAFVASDSLIFTDVTDRNHPVVINAFPLLGYGGTILGLGDYLYISTFHPYSPDTVGIQIISIADLSSPQLVAERQINMDLRDIAVRGDYIFATADSVLLVFYFPSTGIDDRKNPIPGFSLNDNYPNPFNAATVISYTIPEKMPVTFSIFNINGQRVAKIDDGIQPMGNHKITWDASGLPSGIYFAHLDNGDQSQCIKMVLLK
jgi:hypothetical protein